MKKSVLSGLTFLAIVVVIAFFGFFYGRDFVDYWRAKDFIPSAKIIQIVEKIKPTDRAKNIFFATNPQVLSSEEFNLHCSRALEKTTILGCYKADSIFIFDVENTDLDGVQEVTAAHELLHAVWSRMSSNEKSHLGGLLRDDYERIKTPELEATMAAYAESQPGEHENELHSILGTEFTDLSSELEAHYSKVFEARSEIVAMNSKYKSKFRELEARAQNLNQELENLKVNIEAKSDDFKVKVDALNLRIDTFNARAESGYYSNLYSFQTDRNSILAQQNYLEEYRQQINAQVADFNKKLKELEAISNQIQRLYDSMNSRVEQVEGIKSI